MPSIHEIRDAVASLPKGPPIVAVLAGGTTGIGSYIATELAKTFAEHGKRLRVYIVGRNITRAELLMGETRKISPSSEWTFVKATDLTLISEVDKACENIIQEEKQHPFHGGLPRIDLLYMSHGFPILKRKTTTAEGLDAFMSSVYYSRMRFITQLLPYLTASPITGRVVSIYAGGIEDGTKAGETPIGSPPEDIYGVASVRKHTCFMKTFMFEEFAKQNAGRLSLSHIFPGLVDGPGFLDPEMPAWFRFAWQLFKPLTRFFMVSAEHCGLTSLYLATSAFPGRPSDDTEGKKGVAMSSNGEVGGGCYTVGSRGETGQNGISYADVREADTAQKVWSHTMSSLAEIADRNLREP